VIDPLGKGFAYPLRTTPRGSLAVARQDQKIRESIRIILGTQVGERVMRPDFGSNLKSLVFAPNSPATASLARHYVEEALTRWEPRITLEEVAVRNDLAERALVIDVHYHIAATFQRQNLVFPLYLEPQ
jgi:phage baseplate assembly protein W